MNCCGRIFSEFQFQDLRSAKPLKQKGVYVIRIKKKGTDTNQIILQVKPLLKRLNWNIVEEFVTNRMGRILFRHIHRS